MIVKSIDDKILDNRYTKSGFRAEEKMNFYLKRAYESDDNIYVINDLRLELGDDHAQIDHLIIHRFGFIVIESKSVSSKISVNKYGEWKRIFNGVETGMPSPILQAKRQVEFLKKFLLQKNPNEIYRDSLAMKYLPPSIEKFGYDVLVAISDSGIIEREEIELSEICKADIITERISDITKKYHKQFSKILSINIPNHFHKDSMRKLSNLLVSEHSPANNSKIGIDMVEEKLTKYKTDTIRSDENRESNEEIYLCKYCKSPNLEIRNGKYGFYFKCLFCNKNTPLKLVCSNPMPECNPILKQDGLDFYRICSVCGENKLFFTNRPIKKEKVVTAIEIPKTTIRYCNKCKSSNIQIVYGKYGYYYKCQDCNANSKIILTCKKSSCKPKLKKEKEKFYKICNDCNIKELFFVNN